MRAADDDLRTLGRSPHLDDVRLDAAVRLGPFVGHLLGLRQQRFDAAEIEQRVARVALLDDAGDDVALAAGVLLVFELALGLANALCHHLTERLRRDATEVLRRHVTLVADRLAFFVEFLREDADLAGVRIDRDERVLGCPGHAFVGRLERVGQCREQRVDRDAFFCRERAKRF